MTNPPTSPWLVRAQQILTFLFLLYVLFLLGRSAWVNAGRNQATNDLRHKINDLHGQIDRLNDQIAWEQTTTFKELEARRKLGLKKPGELVIALPPEPDQPKLVATTPLTQTPAYQVFRSWWEYYFATAK